MPKYKLVLKDEKPMEFNQEHLDFDRKAKWDWCGKKGLVGITHYGTSHYNRLICKECAESIKKQDETAFGEGCHNIKDSKKDIKDGEELEFERDGEQDDQYVVIEGTRNGYGINQVESNTITVGELIDILSQFDSDTKVVIGNDFRRGHYYTYGHINQDTINSVTVIEPEEDYEEEE